MIDWLTHISCEREVWISNPELAKSAVVVLQAARHRFNIFGK